MERHINTKTYVENAGTVVINESDKPSLPSNIPSPKDFIGRETELNILRNEKANGKNSFVLHGAGGVGKTDLALEFIKGIKPEFEKHFRVDMLGLSQTPKSIKEAKLAIIRAFGQEVSTDVSDEDANIIYDSLLLEHKTILLLDNAKDRNHVEQLNNPSAFVVITSRETFNVTGGFSYELNQMSPEDARRLLYKVTNNEECFDGQADALANLAGYLPIALLPLASLLVEDITLKAADLVNEYSKRKTRLSLADPNRENLSVEASFDLSYERLSDELKAYWRKLAVFPADFDLEAMQYVWQIKDGKAIRSELIKKHLLEYDKTTERSYLHDLAFAYTDKKLIDKERFEAHKLHAAYFVLILLKARKIQDTQTETSFLDSLKLIDLEWANIVEGQNWASANFNNDDEIALLFSSFSGAYPYINLRLSGLEHIKWLNSALDVCRKNGNIQDEGSILGNLGIAYANLGDYQKAINYCEQALKISKQIGDRKSDGYILGNLGSSYANLGEYHKAIEYYEDALKISQEIGDRKGEGNSLGNLGASYKNLSDYQKGIDYQNQALQIFKEIGDRQGESYTVSNLGSAYTNLGDYQKAIDYLNQALNISKEIGDRQGEGKDLGNLGSTYANLGEKEKARDYYLQSITILEAIGSPNAENVKRNLARLDEQPNLQRIRFTCFVILLIVVLIIVGIVFLIRWLFF